METTQIALIFSLIILILFIIIAVKVSFVAKYINIKYDATKCLAEYNIAIFSGDDEAALKWYYRHLYYKYIIFKSNSDESDKDYSTKLDIFKAEHLPIIKKLNGTWPADIK